MNSDKMPAHPLEGARFAAALAIAGIGGGIGIALMLAQTLILVGFAVSLLSVGAILWMYLSQLKSVFTCLRSKQPCHEHIVVTEIIAAAVLIIGLIVISVPIYFIKIKDGPILNKSMLLFQTATQERISDTQSRINGEFLNRGNLTANDLYGYVGAIVADSPLDQSITDVYLGRFTSIINENDLKNATHLDSGTTEVINAIDIEKNINNKFYSGGKNYTNALILLNNDQIKDIGDGKKLLYVVYAIRYDDEENGSWQVTGCAFFTGKTSYFRTCGGGQPERVLRVKS
jgi:hypothetical protein